MNTRIGLLLAIVLYGLFSAILWTMFHTMIMFFIAGIATAIAGTAIYRLFEGAKG